MNAESIKALRQPIPLAMLGGGIVGGILIAFFVFQFKETWGPSSVDPNAKYRDMQLRKGMLIDDLKKELGEPDVTGAEGWVWNDGPSASQPGILKDPTHGGGPSRFGKKHSAFVWKPTASKRYSEWVEVKEVPADSFFPVCEYKYYYQELHYGAFGAHHQKLGHVTKYRLTLEFIDGRLIWWEKSTPTGEG